METQLTNHPGRRNLLALVDEHPGVRPADAARLLNVDPTTVTYHAKRLAKAGLLVLESPTKRGFCMFTPRGAQANGGRGVAGATRHACADRMLRLLEAPPFVATRVELAARSGYAYSTVKEQATSLLRLGVLTEDGGGGLRRAASPNGTDTGRA